VRTPTNPRSLVRLRFSRNLVVFSLQPTKNSFACRQLVILSHRFRWFSSVFLFTRSFIKLAHLPTAGSGPTNFELLPFLANSSALSFPGTPECPGTHANVTKLSLDRASRDSKHLRVISDENLKEDSATTTYCLNRSISFFLEVLLPTSLENFHSSL